MPSRFAFRTLIAKDQNPNSQDVAVTLWQPGPDCACKIAIIGSSNDIAETVASHHCNGKTSVFIVSPFISQPNQAVYGCQTHVRSLVRCLTTRAWETMRRSSIVYLLFHPTRLVVGRVDDEGYTSITPSCVAKQHGSLSDFFQFHIPSLQSTLVLAICVHIFCV